MDTTIAEFIYPRLKAFNESEKMSISPSFFNDQEKMDHNDEEWAEARKNQKDAYDKIELAFKYMIADGMDMDSGIDHEKYPDFQEAMNNTDKVKWEAYRAEMIRREDCMKEGLELLAKHFFTLWD